MIQQHAVFIAAQANSQELSESQKEVMALEREKIAQASAEALRKAVLAEQKAQAEREVLNAAKELERRNKE